MFYFHAAKLVGIFETLKSETQRVDKRVELISDIFEKNGFNPVVLQTMMKLAEGQKVYQTLAFDGKKADHFFSEAGEKLPPLDVTNPDDERLNPRDCKRGEVGCRPTPIKPVPR